MRKPTNLKKEQRNKKRMREGYDKNHHQYLVTSILKMMIGAKVIDENGDVLMNDEQVALFLATITEDVTKNIPDGAGKKDFATAILQIAEHYGVLHMFAEEEEVEIVD